MSQSEEAVSVASFRPSCLAASNNAPQHAGARHPALVMLFDEPTSTLGPELLARHDRRSCLILVTHEQKFARNVASHIDAINYTIAQ